MVLFCNGDGSTVLICGTSLDSWLGTVHYVLVELVWTFARSRLTCLDCTVPVDCDAILTHSTGLDPGLKPCLLVDLVLSRGCSVTWYLLLELLWTVS